MSHIWVRHLTSLEMVGMDEHVAKATSSRHFRFYLPFLPYVVALGTMLDLSVGEEALPLLFIAF